MYTDYDYYTSAYLLGRAAQISEEEFLFWEKEAGREIDARTFGRVKKLKEISEEVKDCSCAVAELLYRVEQASKEASAIGAAGPLASYSNDGQSGTFTTDQNGIYTQAGKQAEIKRLITLYLGHTGLLYAGVMRCEP